MKQLIKNILRLLVAPLRFLLNLFTRDRSKQLGEIKKITCPNDKFLPQVRQVISEGHTATISVKGYSMRPFLEHARDKVILSPFTTLAVGDAVLAEIAPGVFVLHRIIRMDGGNITLMGDGNVRGVEYCRYENVAGVVTTYLRNGRKISSSSKRLQRAVRLWRALLPVRRYLLFVYKLFL